MSPWRLQCKFIFRIYANLNGRILSGRLRISAYCLSFPIWRILLSRILWNYTQFRLMLPSANVVTVGRLQADSFASSAIWALLQKAFCRYQHKKECESLFAQFCIIFHKIHRWKLPSKTFYFTFNILLRFVFNSNHFFSHRRNSMLAEMIAHCATSTQPSPTEST